MGEILIKKVEIDIKKGKIFIDYVEGTKQAKLSDIEPPRPEFISSLKDLYKIGVKILNVHFSIKDRFIIKGVKLGYLNNGINAVTLIGCQILPTGEEIAQPFPKRLCKFNKGKFNLQEEDCFTINRFVEECKLYILGKRAQTKLQV